VRISIYNNVVKNQGIAFVDSEGNDSAKINRPQSHWSDIDDTINTKSSFLVSAIWNNMSKIVKQFIPNLIKCYLALFIFCIAIPDTVTASNLLVNGKKEAIGKAVEEPEKALSADNKADGERKNQRDIGTLRERRDEILQERNGLKNHSQSSGFLSDLKLIIGIPLFGLLAGIAVALFLLPIKILFGE